MTPPARRQRLDLDVAQQLGFAHEPRLRPAVEPHGHVVTRQTNLPQPWYCSGRDETGIDDRPAYGATTQFVVSRLQALQRVGFTD